MIEFFVTIIFIISAYFLGKYSSKRIPSGYKYDKDADVLYLGFENHPRPNCFYGETELGIIRIDSKNNLVGLTIPFFLEQINKEVKEELRVKFKD